MHDPGRASDEELADLVRAGDEQAFAVLWERHARAGLAAARQFRNLADPEDLVSDAYLQILRALQHGGGPHEAFRPYLYRTIRNTAINRRRDDGAVSIDAIAEIEHPEPGPEDTAIRNTITARAFRTLPERWQTVLWYTEVEGMEPAEVAPLLALTPNGVAALAYRAREGLKKAWLQAHVSDQRVPAGCRWTTERMGDYVRDQLSPVARLRFDQHLESCTRCSILVEEIDDLGHRLAVVLFPIVLGGSAAAGLLAERSIDGWHDPHSTASAGSAAGGATALSVAAPASAAAAGGATAASRPIALLVGGIVTVAVAALAGTALALAGVFAPSDAGGPHAGGPVATSDPGDERPEPVPTSTPTVTPPPSPEPTPPPVAEPPAPAPPPPTVPPPTRPTPTDPPPTEPPPADTTPPAAPVLAGDLDGFLGNDPLPTLGGTGEPGAHIELELLDDPDAGPFASAIVADDGSWLAVPTAPLPDGEHRIHATQVDANGNRSTPTEFTITIDTVALPPMVTTPPGEHRVLPEVTGTAEPGASVELSDADGEPLGSTVAGPDGAWMLPLPDPAAGTQTVTAIQTDRAGNVSAPSAPSEPILLLRPHFTAPADGAQLPAVDGSRVVEVRFDGDAGRQVEVLLDGVSTGHLHTLGDSPLVRVTPPLAVGEHTIALRYVEGERVGATTVLHLTIV